MNPNGPSALHRGVKMLHDPVRNKGTTFTDAKCHYLNLRGLLPARVHSMAEQESRMLGNIRVRATDLVKRCDWGEIGYSNNSIPYHKEELFE